MKTAIRLLVGALLLCAGPAHAVGYWYLTASSCHPLPADCSGCVKGKDSLGREIITIPNSASDQTIVCDVTFPNNAVLPTVATTVFWHANSVDTSKNACWRTSSRFVNNASDLLTDLNADLTNVLYFSAPLSTPVGAIANQHIESDVGNQYAFTDVSSGGALHHCDVLTAFPTGTRECRGHPGAVFVQRRGSSNCANSLTAVDTIFDQLNFLYTTP